jgi:hypothetical protein
MVEERERHLSPDSASLRFGLLGQTPADLGNEDPLMQNGLKGLAKFRRRKKTIFRASKPVGSHAKPNVNSK